MLIEWVEGEEVVAVIFVLFAAGGDFGWQAIFEIADQRFEAIEDGDDFFLDGERENWDNASFSKKAYPIENSYGRGLPPSGSAHPIKSLADRDKTYPSNNGHLINNRRAETSPALTGG